LRAALSSIIEIRRIRNTEKYFLGENLKKKKKKKKQMRNKVWEILRIKCLYLHLKNFEF